jgi:hypothetical protein
MQPTHNVAPAPAAVPQPQNAAAGGAAARAGRALPGADPSRAAPSRAACAPAYPGPRCCSWRAQGPRAPAYNDCTAGSPLGAPPALPPPPPICTSHPLPICTAHAHAPTCDALAPHARPAARPPAPAAGAPRAGPTPRAARCQAPGARPVENRPFAPGSPPPTRPSPQASCACPQPPGGPVRARARCAAPHTKCMIGTGPNAAHHAGRRATRARLRVGAEAHPPPEPLGASLGAPRAAGPPPRCARAACRLPGRQHARVPRAAPRRPSCPRPVAPLPPPAARLPARACGAPPPLCCISLQPSTPPPQLGAVNPFFPTCPPPKPSQPPARCPLDRGHTHPTGRPSPTRVARERGAPDVRAPRPPSTRGPPAAFRPPKHSAGISTSGRTCTCNARFPPIRPTGWHARGHQTGGLARRGTAPQQESRPGAHSGAGRGASALWPTREPHPPRRSAGAHEGGAAAGAAWGSAALRRSGGHAAGAAPAGRAPLSPARPAAKAGGGRSLLVHRVPRIRFPLEEGRGVFSPPRFSRWRRPRRRPRLPRCATAIPAPSWR